MRETSEPLTLEYENRQERDRYSTRWDAAFRCTIAYYTLAVAIGLLVYFGSSMHRLGPYGAMSGASRVDEVAIVLATSNWIPALLLALGLHACRSYRRAHLFQPFRRALIVYEVLVAIVLLLRLAANAHVEWFSRLDLVASGRPYRFIHVRDGADAVINLVVCVFLAAPAFVNPFLWRYRG